MKNKFHIRSKIVVVVLGVMLLTSQIALGQGNGNGNNKNKSDSTTIESGVSTMRIIDDGGGGGTPPSTPGTPTASSNTCGNKTLYRNGTPPSGVYWYWQTSSSGTSTSYGQSTYSASSTRYYYIRAYKLSSGLWSGAASKYVSVNPTPSTPSTPSVQNNCGSTKLTRSTPPSGYTWYWQGQSSSGTSTSNSASTYTASTSGTYYIRGRGNSSGCWGSSRSVSVSLIPATGTPPTPSVTTNTCGNKTLTRSGTKPVGVNWYWQGTNSNGTSTSYSSTTYTVSSTGTYYYRAKDMETGCWSYSVSKYVVISTFPSTPSTPSATTNTCGNKTLTRGTPPSGITWYWQGTSSSGVSTGNSNSTYSATNSGTYYLRARNNGTGCWSTSSASNWATVNAYPATPSNPSISANTCGTKTLTRGTPPSGTTWYWQGSSSSGTSTSNYAATYTVTSTGTYYLRARTSAGCWSSSRSVSVTYNAYPSNPSTPTASTNTCGNKTLSRGTPSGSTWYWQGTNPAGSSTLNSDPSYTASSSGTFYLRARTNAGCWSSTSASVTVSVSQNPTVYNFTGEGSNCSPLGKNLFLTMAENGFTYNLIMNGNIVATVVSTSDGYIDFGSYTITGNYSVIAFNTSQASCTVAMTGSVEINMPPIVNAGIDLEVFVYSPLTLTGGSPSEGVWNGNNVSSGTFDATSAGVGTHELEFTFTDPTTGCVGVDTRTITVIESSDSDKNYIQTKQLQVPISEEANIPYGISDVVYSTTYFNGLGRPIQKVLTGQSPNGFDIVLPIAYDDFGRQHREYLPYVKTETTGSYVESIVDNNGSYTSSIHDNFYNADANPYSEKIFDNSPLNRIDEQYGPGEDWYANTKRTQFSYEVNNDTDDVYLWEIDVTDNAVAKSTPAEYSAGELYKNITVDEQEHEVQEFVNKTGQTILKRVQAHVTGASTQEWADTYYVYDDFGNLRYVLPPEASKNISATPSQSFLDMWAFQYKYDGRKRMIEKQVPGAGVVYMVYDNRDRLVLTQDSNQRVTNEWIFTKYDGFNRPVSTGVYSDTSSRGNMQTAINNYYDGLTPDQDWFESIGSERHNYDNKSFPQTPVEGDYLTITYYDNYEISDTWAMGYVDAQLTQTTNATYSTDETYNDRVKGQITASLIRNLETQELIKTVMFYDSKYRVIQTVAQNHLGGIDRLSSLYDFVGKVLETNQSHSDGTKANLISNKFEYDHSGRLLTHSHDLGLAVEWTDLVGVLIDQDGNLVSTATNGYGNAGAASEGIIEEGKNGWVEFEVESNYRVLVGLSEFNTNAHYNTIDYCIYLSPSRTLNVYENGSYKGGVGTYQDGDKIRIERKGEEIQYYKNGQLLETSSTLSTSSLRVDVSLYYTGDKVTLGKFSTAGLIQLSSNEYNELGELIEKNLHGIPDPDDPALTNFVQSVDYSYNIRGWLTSINDNTLSDGEGDYFGMQLLYNDLPEATLGNTSLFNGNISAVKWTSGVEGAQQQAYTYEYDAMNRIAAANSRKKMGTWISGATNMSVGSYDLNGNIVNLTRQSFEGTMDNLTYDYGTGLDRSNQLQSVSENGGDVTKGFIDGNTVGNDYTYDPNGNMMKDKNKEIDSIYYNHLNLPKKVVKVNGDNLVYVYDATGIKLAQIVFNSAGNTLKRTDYVGAYVYENDTLQFIQIEEGRILVSGGTSEYQYHLKDHLGNTRVSFTTKDEVDIYIATMETEYRAYETATFSNVEETDKQDQFFNHTLSDENVSIPAYSAMLNSVATQIMGPAKSLRVAPGDTVNIEVYAQYVSYSSDGSKVAANTMLAAIAGAFTPIGATTEVIQQVVDQFATAGAGALSPGANTDAPAAFLNFLLFDNNFQLIEPMGFAGVTTAADGAFQKLSISQIPITEAGYMYIYVSNEDAANVNVFFDDLKITHRKSKIVQMDDYYPFGLTFNSFKREDSKGNDFLYQGKEMQSEIATYDFHARMYDPAIGRTFQTDPMSELFYDHSPYGWVKNNPLLRIDPTGMTDYTFDKKSGAVTQVGDVNDEPDRILRTNRKGEVKYKKNGDAKIALGGIEQGILADGQNFKTDDQIIDVGGEGQASLKGVEDFVTRFSEHVGVEFSGAYLSQDDKADAAISKVYIDEYKGNKPKQSSASFTKLFTDSSLKGFNTITDFHTHPSNIGVSRTDVERPSGTTGQGGDLKHRDNQRSHFYNFLILTRTVNYPKEVQRINYTNWKK